MSVSEVFRTSTLGRWRHDAVDGVVRESTRRVSELRQFRDAVVPRRFSQGGWFDRSNDLAFRKIIDIVFIASLGPPGGGRQDMTARFVRPFNVVGPARCLVS